MNCALPNNGVNLTVWPVTRLAGLGSSSDSKGREQGARPSQPAGYAGRYARADDELDGQ